MNTGCIRIIHRLCFWLQTLLSWLLETNKKLILGCGLDSSTKGVFVPKFNLKKKKNFALLKYSDINGFDNISSQNWWFTYQIWYDNFIIRNFIRFLDIYPNFSGFSKIFIFQWFWPYFFTELIVNFSNMIWKFSYSDFYPVSIFSCIYPGFSQIFIFNGFDHISSHNWRFTYQIWYEEFRVTLFCKKFSKSSLSFFPFLRS